MKPQITTINLPMPLKLGQVNCYLINTGDGYILIDTGGANNRAELEKALETAGCRPGDLKLILLTHGDFDHSANAAYLRQKFDTTILMHVDDQGMVERGDMFWNRKSPNAFFKLISPLIFRMGKADRFTPDACIKEGDDLSAYGLEAEILHIPGHSLGSIGVLTAAGDFIGGDLLENTKKPAINGIMDDLTAAHASVEKLNNYPIITFYPGHGKPFDYKKAALT